MQHNLAIDFKAIMLSDTVPNFVPESWGVSVMSTVPVSLIKNTFQTCEDVETATTSMIYLLIRYLSTLI
jgi:hypothetical protein